MITWITCHIWEDEHPSHKVLTHTQLTHKDGDMDQPKLGHQPDKMWKLQNGLDLLLPCYMMLYYAKFGRSMLNKSIPSISSTPPNSPRAGPTCLVHPLWCDAKDLVLERLPKNPWCVPLWFWWPKMPNRGVKQIQWRLSAFHTCESCTSQGFGY